VLLLASCNANNQEAACTRVALQSAVDDYLADADMGTVNIFLRFGNPPGAPDSHTFRLVNGKIRYVHTLTLTVPGTPTEQIMGPPPEGVTGDAK
jgi:hypothetical protein